MRYFKFTKLVRDGVIKSMQDNPLQEPKGVHKLSDQEFKNELIKKLKEEVEELANSETEEEYKEELADIYELLKYLAQLSNVSDDDISLLMQKKVDKAGGFEGRQFIESVGIDEQDVDRLKNYTDN
ncbi:nucleoside triphosphate pyrophosphohydrolase, partial [Candidatus Dojkabacteria bacterium]|nr:nucleoside triphosphate pyrophosphohydrolase [Candidatus Dojkabacteria bacterium]